MAADDLAPLVRGEAALWHGLRSLVERAYDVDALERVSGLRPLSLITMDRLAECRVRIDGDPSCTVAVELFLLGRGVESARAEAGLAPLGIRPFVDAGLVERDGDVIRARVSLLPFEALWLVGDRLDEQGVPSDRRVPNTDLSTLLAASVMSRRPTGSMLDLGTGTGVLALLSAGHCDSVVGVDVNPRSAMFARFNSGLNDVATAEWFEGGFFDHLDGRLFDLVVANPPYIIAPNRDDPHRFGGGNGHSLSREVVRGAAEHLRDGGLAYVLCDVGVGPGRTWDKLLRDWVAGTGCDALLLRQSTTPASAYAAANHDPRAFRSLRDYEDAAGEWLESYRALGITEIASAVVVLRRRPGSGSWAEALALAGAAIGPIDERLLGVLAGVDHFRSLSEEDLRRERLVPVEGHELRQVLHRSKEWYEPQQVQLHFPGLPLVGTLSAEALPVLFALDGTRDVAAVIADVADEYGLAQHDLCERLLPQLRDLGMRGFLRPATVG